MDKEFNEAQSAVDELRAQIAELNMRCCKLAMERDRARHDLAKAKELLRPRHNGTGHQEQPATQEPAP